MTRAVDDHFFEPFDWCEQRFSELTAKLPGAKEALSVAA
jgi:hypothetical protein